MRCSLLAIALAILTLTSLSAQEHTWISGGGMVGVELGLSYNAVGKMTFKDGLEVDYGANDLSPINFTCGVKTGVIRYLNQRIGLSIETGYILVEDGPSVIQFVPIVISSLIRF